MEEKSVKLSDGVAIDVIEGIARICHEINRVYCQNSGDDSQVEWEKAPQWQKDSVMMCVSSDGTLRMMTCWLTIGRYSA